MKIQIRIMQPKQCQYIKQFMLSSVLSLLLFLHSCGLPTNYRIAEVYICQGWDASGRPIDIGNVFSTQDKPLYVCGRAEINHLPTITLSISWRQNGKSIWSNTVTTKTGYFYSQLDSSVYPLAPGDYQVQIWGGRTLLFQRDFYVE